MKSNRYFLGVAAIAGIGILAGVWAIAKVGRSTETAQPSEVKAPVPAPPSEAKAPIPAPPASQPAESIILVRLGDKEVITQADFEQNARGVFPNRYNRIIFDMTTTRLFRLYLRDHPDLVPEAKIDATIETMMKESKMKTRQDLEKGIRQQGLTFDQWRDRLRISLGRGALVQKGEQLLENQKYLKERFDKDPTEFNGTLVSARQIVFNVLPYETPTQREAKRERLRKIRDALISGERTWDVVVMQSDDGSRTIGGTLGKFPRHQSVIEPVAKAAFALKPGEFSDIVESEQGFHLVQTTARTEGTLPFDDGKVKSVMRLWLQNEPFWEAIVEVNRKYPVAGVQPPQRTDFMIRHEVISTTLPAQTRPAVRTRPPAPVNTRPASQPAPVPKPPHQTPNR